MKSVFPFFIFLSSLGASGQGNTQIAYDTREQERNYASRLSRFIPPSELFSNSTFENGYAVYQSGKRSNVLSWNYNRLMHHMVFLAGQDTLFLRHDKQIQSIVTDRDQFYYYPKWGYIQTLPGEGQVKLGKQVNLKILRRNRLSPNEHPEPIVTPDSFSIIYHPESHLLPREQVLLSRRTLFFLLDRAGNVFLANRSGFDKVFSEKRKEIDQLLRQRYAAHDRINFTREEDVRELFIFCTTR